jgi:hypothetical protein
MSLCRSQRNPNFWKTLGLPRPDYTATELGKRIGLSARKFNRLMEGLKYQVWVTDNGPNHWELTEEGAIVGHEVTQMAPHGLKEITYIKWYSNAITW